MEGERERNGNVHFVLFEERKRETEREKLNFLERSNPCAVVFMSQIFLYGLEAELKNIVAIFHFHPRPIFNSFLSGFLSVLYRLKWKVLTILITKFSV